MYPHLPEDEREHWHLYKTQGLRESRDYLFRKYEDLAVWVYSKLAPAFPTHDKDDLKQQAKLFLLLCMERFNPDHGARFSTYATPWVKGKLMNHYNRSSDRVERERVVCSLTDYEDLYTEPDASLDMPTHQEAVMSASLEHVDTLARAALTPEEYRCYWLRFRECRTIPAVEEALGVTRMYARCLIETVREKVIPLLYEAGITSGEMEAL